MLKGTVLKGTVLKGTVPLMEPEKDFRSNTFGLNLMIQSLLVLLDICNTKKANNVQTHFCNKFFGCHHFFKPESWFSRINY